MTELHFCRPARTLHAPGDPCTQPSRGFHRQATSASSISGNLDGDTGTVDRGLRAYPHATVLDILTDRFGFESVNVESRAIVFHWLGADRKEGFADRLGSVLAVTEQVQIPRRPAESLSIGITDGISGRQLHSQPSEVAISIPATPPPTMTTR